MTVARNAADVIANHVTLDIESFDRLNLKVCRPHLQTLGGIAVLFRSHCSQEVAPFALMAPVTRAFMAAIERLARDEGVGLATFRNARASARTTAPRTTCAAGAAARACCTSERARQSPA